MQFLFSIFFLRDVYGCSRESSHLCASGHIVILNTTLASYSFPVPESPRIAPGQIVLPRLM